MHYIPRLAHSLTLTHYCPPTLTHSHSMILFHIIPLSASTFVSGTFLNVFVCLVTRISVYHTFPLSRFTYGTLGKQTYPCVYILEIKSLTLPEMSEEILDCQVFLTWPLSIYHPHLPFSPVTLLPYPLFLHHQVSRIKIGIEITALIKWYASSFATCKLAGGSLQLVAEMLSGSLPDVEWGLISSSDS